MLSYNHASYIRQAIDSVISQETDCMMEVIIHDDASTDGSSQIIQEYANLYPDMIKPILQEVNQYSKNNKVWLTHVWEKCSGDFIAFCECDDYWTDCKKLDKQIRFLLSNPDCSAVYHNCEVVDERSNRLENYEGLYPWRPESDYDLKQVALTGLYPGQTATSLFRRDVFECLNSDKNDLQDMRVNGDKLNLVLALKKGRVHVMQDVMSAYRLVVNQGNSWSARTHGKNMSDVFFIANYDLNDYFKKAGAGHLYMNHYFIFRAGMAAWIKSLKSNSAEDRDVFRNILNEFKSKGAFFLFLAKMGLIGIPLNIYSKIKYC